MATWDWQELYCAVCKEERDFIENNYSRMKKGGKYEK